MMITFAFVVVCINLVWYLDPPPSPRKWNILDAIAGNENVSVEVVDESVEVEVPSGCYPRIVCPYVICTSRVALMLMVHIVDHS